MRLSLLKSQCCHQLSVRPLSLLSTSAALSQLRFTALFEADLVIPMLQIRKLRLQKVSDLAHVVDFESKCKSNLHPVFRSLSGFQFPQLYNKRLHAGPFRSLETLRLTQ